jgi:hypothetical protein
LAQLPDPVTIPGAVITNGIKPALKLPGIEPSREVLPITLK